MSSVVFVTCNTYNRQYCTDRSIGFMEDFNFWGTTINPNKAPPRGWILVTLCVSIVVVSELSEIMTVMIDEQKVSPGGTGYTVYSPHTLPYVCTLFETINDLPPLITRSLETMIIIRITNNIPIKWTQRNHNNIIIVRVSYRGGGKGGYPLLAPIPSPKICI